MSSLPAVASGSDGWPSATKGLTRRLTKGGVMNGGARFALAPIQPAAEAG